MEIESMLHARWREGMVPHLHYDPDYLRDYFPGPDRWPGALKHVAAAGELTSGISNPPVLALAARRVGERQADPGLRHAFWQRVFPALRDWIRYFLVDRRLDGRPLVAVVHPWESGWDNSPRWDFLAQAGLKPKRPYQRQDTTHVNAAHRPTNKDYDAYVALAELLGEVDYDVEKYRARSPFCVYDTAMDSIFYRAALDLNAIAEQLGQPPVAESRELAEFRAAFDEIHWDEDAGLYLDWDCVGRRRINVPTAATLVSLVSGIVAHDLAGGVWQRYQQLQGGSPLVKTAPPSVEGFDPSNYWRGPVWLNVNWLVAEGLQLSGLEEEAGRLRQESLGLVRRFGFAEFFDGESGEPRGTSPFSWTAALTLELLERER